jgi:uncharacterized protein (DUF2237 family)
MTKNFLFMTKGLWQSGSNKLSFMTRRRKKKKGLQAATKWSLRRGWWQILLKASAQSSVRQSLALKHALCVTIADTTALVELFVAPWE